VIRRAPGPPPEAALNPLTGYVFAGHTGVTLFFVLSAFLLARPFLAQAAGQGPVSLAGYARRRVLRIVPLYALAVLTATLVLASAGADLLTTVSALSFDPRFDNFALFPFSVVWWSLRTEVQFYLLLPLLPLAIGSRPGRVVTVCILSIWAVGYVILATGAVRLSDPNQFRMIMQSVLGRAPAFLLGIGAAWFYRRHGARLRARLASHPLLARGGGDLLLLGLLAGLGWLLAVVAGVGVFKAELRHHYWHVAEALIWTSVLLCLLLVPMYGRRLWSNALLDRLGVISYSVYLIHYPVLFYGLAGLSRADPERFSSWTPWSVLATLLLSGLALALSAASYRWVERPFLRLKRRHPR
jgi:peptidoglycan/LPS O-acetylase OafA/YrhL